MPEAKDGRMGFVTINNNLELGLEEAVNRRDDDVEGEDDDVEGEDDEVIFLSSPLEVIFRADLNGGGMSEGGGYYGFVVCNVEQLGGGEAFVLKSS